MDFRSDKMESREGKGLAKRAWEGYARAVNRAGLPLLEPIIGRYSVSKVVDLAGFWMVWPVFVLRVLSSLELARNACRCAVTASGTLANFRLSSSTMLEPAASSAW